MSNGTNSNLSRRRFIATGIAAAVVAAAPRHLFAATQGIVPTMVDAAKKAKIVVTPLRRNISVLEGSGGNIAVLTGEDGKLLVDSGFAVSRPRIAEALNRLSSDPIAQLLNTHWHTDHTDGNAWIHKAGARITAHVNARRHLAATTRVEAWAWTFPPAPSDALPTIVFDDVHRLRHNHTNIALNYYGPAHTDCDISVLFEEADIVHVGDTWWNGLYPFIDYSTGGSIDGMIHATRKNLDFITDKMTVVPGHGPAGNKAELAQFGDMLVTTREKVAALKQQGLSIEETIAAKPTSAFDAKYGGFLITPAFFTTLIYSGV